MLTNWWCTNIHQNTRQTRTHYNSCKRHLYSHTFIHSSL